MEAAPNKLHLLVKIEPPTCSPAYFVTIFVLKRMYECEKVKDNLRLLLNPFDNVVVGEATIEAWKKSNAYLESIPETILRDIICNRYTYSTDEPLLRMQGHQLTRQLIGEIQEHLKSFLAATSRPPYPYTDQ